MFKVITTLVFLALVAGQAQANERDRYYGQACYDMASNFVPDNDKIISGSYWPSMWFEGIGAFQTSGPEKEIIGIEIKVKKPWGSIESITHVCEINPHNNSVYSHIGMSIEDQDREQKYWRSVK